MYIILSNNFIFIIQMLYKLASPRHSHLVWPPFVARKFTRLLLLPVTQIRNPARRYGGFLLLLGRWRDEDGEVTTRIDDNDVLLLDYMFFRLPLRF